MAQKLSAPTIDDIKRSGSVVVDALVIQAYEAGYKAAYAEVKSRFSKADFTTFLNSLFAQAIASGADDFDAAAFGRGPIDPEDAEDGASAAAPPVHEYGAISNTVREVMKGAPRRGLLITDVAGRSKQDHGVDVTVRQAREALKRLKAAKEVDCLGRRFWVATDKLSGDAAKENGAQNGQATRAPETREGYQPSLIENREGLRLQG